MFYVIALAGAHKRVINQLREQLAMVSSHKNTFRDHVISFIFILINLICSPFYSNKYLCLFLFSRRAVTNASWSRSCARPRGPQPSNLQGPTFGTAAAAAAAATTPASPTISTRQCSSHTHLQTPPHMCEAKIWHYRPDARLDKNVLYLKNSYFLLF